MGNELAVYEEYPAHPGAGEGPWHLLPKGPIVFSSTASAEVQAYRGPLGERLVVRGRIGELLCYKQTLTLWHGVDRLDCQTTIDDFAGADRLVRLRWPCPVPGALPVSEVGDAVIGRGFGADHGLYPRLRRRLRGDPWTLEDRAYGGSGRRRRARCALNAGGARCVGG